MTRSWVVALVVISACRTAAPVDTRPCALGEHHLRLPFPDGERFKVMQGNHGRFSHRGLDEYAWDFAMPEGTPIAAAEDGIVVEVEREFSAGGDDPSLADRANVVFIDHGDGHFSVYQHLMFGGIFVEEGDVVAQGQVIARSGNTGWSTTPHLHFELIDHRNRSQPVCFDGVRIPVEGRSYEAQGPERHTPHAVTQSTLPRDAFLPNDVELTNAVPARRIPRDVPLVVEGKALRHAARAVLFFVPRDRGEAVLVAHGAVADDGSFRIEADVSPLEGPYGMAVALETIGGGYFSRFTVPVVVRARVVTRS